MAHNSNSAHGVYLCSEFDRCVDAHLLQLPLHKFSSKHIIINILLCSALHHSHLVDIAPNFINISKKL